MLVKPMTTADAAATYNFHLRLDPSGIRAEFPTVEAFIAHTGARDLPPGATAPKPRAPARPKAPTISHAEALARFRAKSAPAAVAPEKVEGRWNRLIEKHIADGLTRGQAIRAAVAEDPDLHRAWLAERQGDRGTVAAPKPTTTATTTGKRTPHAFWAEVERRTASGLSKGQAIRQAVHARPDLHRAWKESKANG